MTNDSIIEDLRLIEPPSLWRNPLTWIVIAVVALAAIYWFARYLKNRPRPLKEVAQPIPGPPPHVVALKRLQELRAKHATISAYEVALECSDILRRFIEARFQSPIRYQTTREFLGEVHAKGELHSDSRRELGSFLEFFDGIKFAQESASGEQTISAIDHAEKFVRRCIPAEVAAA
jgi:hypothetical protein